MINEALFESKPANYQDLEEILYTYTDGFTKEEGEYPLDTRKEREEAARILNKYYEEVEKNDLDYDRKNEGGTVDYKVKFKTPKLEVTPDKDPENFNQFVDDSFEDSPVFEALLEEDYMENDIDEAIEKHDTLNPDLWDENNELLPDVKEKLQEIVNKFISNLEENDIKLDVEDICIIGSNASYNYNDQSDIDLHIIADPSVYSDEDLALKIYLAYKSLFNNKYDPLIRGHEVEIYVEPHEVQANSKGIYSLNNG